ncbi:hypothetical protein PSACC_02364 [Paramicrosporidium saccamoebae]|uniref:Rad21/Rec8-like protein C-terminal eukaryotic domain-containing protein n=1 Tax=Paramicrosporidium saccamoebae TaxID=1246581 RepID=A0A2H9TJ90_9FUNG|nr:hypothetical protein PSACC_02364 [Paramicrosporidium saccamoebae]
MAAQPMRRPNLEYDASNLNFGLGPAKEDELPSEFQMDVEFGRRATMDGNLMSDPLRQSIEAGRRAESPRPSLPFSPLRTPTKNVDFEFEQVPLNEDFGYFDEPPMPEVPFNDRLSAPPAPVSAVAVTRQARIRRTRSIKPVSLDVEIEVSNNFIQECVRDSTPILLPKPSWNNHSLAESLCLLSIEAPARPKVATIIEPALEFEEQVPLNDDDYALGPADFAMEADVPMPRSPKSPRIMNDENAVPNFNRSITNSPTKQRTASLSLSDESLDILAIWQQAFRSAHSLQFDKLVPTAHRKQVADSFLQLLVLQTKGLVISDQQVPFGAITVQPTDALFNATSEVLKLS